ncbi:MAG TPA: ABC transporter ATP-binding protein [Candidatus Acidoferrales bacterium]|nr:ABC transporter ATP-binding protein [Candidatus Acidoferrales bacterium]
MSSKSKSADDTASTKSSKPKFDWKLLPDVLALLKPRRGILAVGFLLMVINRASGLILPGSSKYLFDNVLIKHQLNILAPLVLAVLGATLVQGLTSYSLTQILSKSSHRMIAELRLRVQAHVGGLPVSYYDSSKSGVLVSRIMSDVEGIRNLLGTGLVDFAGSILTASFALIYLLKTSVIMTAAASAGLVVFGFGISRAFKVIRPIYRARPKINAEVTGRLTESLGGVRVVKGYYAEEREEKVFAGGVQRLLDNVIQTLTATSLMSFSATALLGVISAVIMYIGAHEVIAGALSPGGLVAYVAFLGMLTAPVAQIVSIGPQITEALAGLERTREVLNEIREHDDPGRTVQLGRVQGHVQFENVSFAYDPKKPVLMDVSFETEPGTVTALVGPSGAGKSTMIGLIAAFYTPTAGRVLVDRMDLAKVRLDSYRTQLGVVLQETFLFDGTIRENVAFARPESTEAEILAACRIARVDEFAETFENKYDTVVGERGVKLSGGQKQRVSIARAILADPRILILDEATSSLDSESEALIQEGLRYLLAGRTTFVIAHRLSTVRRADQILVVEAGRIVERGTHDSLYAKGGRYYELYTRQHGVASNLFLAPGESTQDEDAEKISSGRANGGPDGGSSSGSSAVSDAIRLIRGQNS